MAIEIIRFFLAGLLLLSPLLALAISPMPACPPGSQYLDQCIGKRQYAKEVSYSGAFELNQPEGTGTMTWQDGISFVGVFSGGRPTQDGVYRDRSGTLLTGINRRAVELIELGKLTFDSGNSYEGEYRNGKPHGKGTYFYRDGTRYVGAFREGVRTGQGVEYDRTGAVSRSGEWKLDELIRSDVSLVQERDTKLQREQQEKLKSPKLDALSVQSGKRIALVIGNSKYIRRPLNNPANDADDISEALRSANFEVIDLREATLPQMRTAVRQFGDKLLQNDVGLVYYSGHGIEVKGKNYFIPVNADIQREDEIVDQSLDVSLILEKMTTAGKGINILIVDACRDDPFGRSFRSTSRGLATMDAPTGTIIAYATSPGRVASDGDGRNSPYTRALVKAMQTPNKPIEQVFKEVRRSVRELTKNQQTPWENTSLSGDFYFRVQK